MFDFEWRIRRWQVWRQSAIGVSNSRNAIQRNIHSGTMPMQFISVPSMKEPESASPIAMGWPEDHQPLIGRSSAYKSRHVESQNSTSISFTSQQSKHSIISTTSQSRENVPLPSVSRNICLASYAWLLFSTAFATPISAATRSSWYVLDTPFVLKRFPYKVVIE